MAQLSAPSANPSKPANEPAAAPAQGIEQRVERIHIEDAGARIDELRVGGETRSITVQPTVAMPTYQVAPDSGLRSWKLLAF